MLSQSYSVAQTWSSGILIDCEDIKYGPSSCPAYDHRPIVMSIASRPTGRGNGILNLKLMCTSCFMTAILLPVILKQELYYQGMQSGYVNNVELFSGEHSEAKTSSFLLFIVYSLKSRPILINFNVAA